MIRAFVSFMVIAALTLAYLAYVWWYQRFR